MYWWDSNLTGLNTKTLNGGIRMDLNCGSQVQLLNSWELGSQAKLATQSKELDGP